MLILLLLVFIVICLIIILAFFIKWSEAKISHESFLRTLESNRDTITTGVVDRNVEKSQHKRESFENLIPVIKDTEGIPGLSDRELVHFLGKGKLYSIETEEPLEKVKIDKKNLQTVLEGTVTLTSKNILIFNKDNVKRIPHGKIEKIGWNNGYIIIKRKGVKKKREVFEVQERGPFRYILKTLHTK